MGANRFHKRAAAGMLIAILVAPLLLTGCAASAPLPSGAGAEWNVVVIGDSSMWEHGQAIASQVEQDLGVKVTLEDFALPALRASTVREVLETGKSENSRLEALPEAVREAEVVVMFANPLGSMNEGGADPIEFCFLAVMPESACSAEMFSGYTADLKAIWAELIALRKGKETIFVATDIYNPLVSNWSEAGALDACTACWEAMSAAAREAAAAHNIPFISRYDAFNGTAHSEDPRGKGLIRDDGEHPTELMGAEFAKLLASRGYAPVAPSK